MDKVPYLRPISKKVKAWAAELIPDRNIYYRRKGRFVTCACSACGKMYTGTVEPSPDIDGLLERYIPASHNTTGECPLCHALATYRAAGRIKRRCGIWKYFIVGQCHKNGFVFRAFCVHRTMRLISVGDAIEPSPDIDEITEYARVFLNKGMKPVTWWQGHDFRTGAESWQNWYPGYYGSAHIHEDNYYPGTFEELKKCEITKYGNPGNNLPIRYYSAFTRYPDFEIVQKAGMHHLESMLLSQSGANINPRGKTIHDRLRIYKERLPELRKRKGSGAYLKACQYERKNSLHFTTAQLEEWMFINEGYRSQADQDVYRRMLKHTTITKILHYLDKLKAEHLGEYTWLDYIRMRARLGYDLDNEVYLFPKDLRRKHNELVEIIDRERNDKRKAEMLKKFPEVRKKYTKLNKKYTFTDGDYMIRPAKDAAEIVEEGRILHHCVGSSDTYFNKIKKGESFILFLRAAAAPDIPLATIEIRGQQILQWYEAHDEKPDEDILQPWLDKYTKQLGEKDGKSCSTVSADI